MSEKKKLKHSDIRAGKLPGWPNRPETNGDPFDPNNWERSDAAMAYTEGHVLKNVISRFSAEIVGKRRRFLTFGLLAAWATLGYNLTDDTGGPGLITQSVSFVSPTAGAFLLSVMHENEMKEQAKSEERKEKKLAKETIKMEKMDDAELAVYKLKKQPEPQAAYYLLTELIPKIDTGIAKDYTDSINSVIDLNVKKYNDVSFTANELKKFNSKLETDEYIDMSHEVAKICEGSSLTECMGKLNTEQQFVALVISSDNPALYESGKTVSYYDGKHAYKDIEAAIAKAADEKRDKNGWCESPLRFYSETPHYDEYPAIQQKMAAAWQENPEGSNSFGLFFQRLLSGRGYDFGEAGAVKAKNISDLVSHSEDCLTAPVKFLRLNDDAAQYLVSIATRTYTEKGHNISSVIYLAGETNESRPFVGVSCINCAEDLKRATVRNAEVVQGFKHSADELADIAVELTKLNHKNKKGE